jgi:hypothetical protein
MNPSRSRRRWWLFALLILFGQVALIFWLSDYSIPTVRPPATAPALHLIAGETNELFDLNDPTLFALPHARGFSGLAWKSRGAPPTRSFEWTAELEWLPLPARQLGQGLARFLQTNQVEPLTTVAPPEPQLIQPQFFSTEVFPRKSSVRIEGPLKSRKLLTPLQPSSWPHPRGELLTNTVVELFVGEDGRPVLWNRLQPGSGSRDADQQAVALARSARFESLVREGPRHDSNAIPATNLVHGTLIFQWHTAPATNSTPAGP